MTAVVVGETIVGGSGSAVAVSEEDKYLRGYNTYLAPSGEIVAAVTGMLETTDCVVSVRGMGSRYMPEVGDVVVGRISDVMGNKWKVELGGLLDGVMLLSNVTEPGGILRRRGRDDELSMRNIFKEDDVIIAEVQRVAPTGQVSLHTRIAEKYGKVHGTGRLVQIKPALVRRTRHQFHCFLSHRVFIVLGMNGWIWVSAASTTQLKEAQDKSMAKRSEESGSDVEEDNADQDDQQADLMENTDDAEVLQCVAFFANCTQVLGNAGVVIYNRTILAAVRACLTQGWKPYDALRQENADFIVRAAREAALKTRRHRK